MIKMTMNPNKITLARTGRGDWVSPRPFRPRIANPSAPPLPPASTKTGLTYATDIKPIFDANCVKCHSGDQPKAHLNLDTLEGILKGSK